jgi:antitoxin (DNA-binding transcriptional repressor) of toxin-antitoxin stability system
VPYFYSDQYDLGMECAGLPSPGTYDQVLYRGDRDALEFIAFWLSGGVVIAGMNVNVWDVNDDIQTLIRAARPVDPARLTNPDIPLTDLYPTSPRRDSRRSPRSAPLAAIAATHPRHLKPPSRLRRPGRPTGIAVSTCIMRSCTPAFTRIPPATYFPSIAMVAN